MHRIFFIFPLLLLFFFSDMAAAQDEQEVIPRSRLTVQNADTRSLALGSSTVADIYFSDAFGMNPAIVGFGEHGNYIYGSLNQDWNTNILQATLSLPRLEVGRHSLGTRLSVANRGPATINIGDAPAFNPSYTLVQAGVAYAYRIHEHLSLGALQYVTYADHLSDSDLSYGADIGLLYAPDGAVTYAIAFRGLGQDPVVISDDAGERLNYEMMHQVLEIGATLRYPEFEDYHYFSFSLSNEKRFNEDGMWYKAGLEVLPVSFIALRSGLMLQTDDNRLIPRFGIGMSFPIIRFDYSIGPNERNDVRFHQFGLSLQL